MGGRGASFGSGGGGGSTADKALRIASGGVIEKAEPTKIETTYRESRGFSPSYYGDEVLEATADANGNVRFSYAKGGEYTKTAKTNRTNYVTFEIVAGAVNGKTFNINWDKVNSISGQTYNLRSQAKDAGLKWDGTTKTWRRK